MLHGQMKPKEKEEMMRKFKDREFDILVATSVVEVGVDMPNASIMMIEGADRFGLAQLYQFRGRVGRGEHQSYCFLMADSKAEAANARLHAILEAKNGFELAEKDLALRGPGQFFGDVQTGIPDIAMEALRDPELVKHAPRRRSRSSRTIRGSRRMSGATEEGGRIPREGASGIALPSYVLPLFGRHPKPKAILSAQHKSRLRFKPGERAENDQRERHQDPLQNKDEIFIPLAIHLALAARG